MSTDEATWRLPDPSVLHALGVYAKFPEDWERGKKLQRELGFGAIPAKAECEKGAGFWYRMTQAVNSHDDLIQMAEGVEQALTSALNYVAQTRRYVSHADLLGLWSDELNALASLRDWQKKHGEAQ
jgi:hypothetical protein